MRLLSDPLDPPAFQIGSPLKVCSSSIRFWLWERKYGEAPPARINLWKWAQGLTLQDPMDCVPLIAVHRDPIRRFWSAYWQKHVKHRWNRSAGAPIPVRKFAEHLRDGLIRHQGMAHHLEAQTMWLGEDPDLFAAIIPFEEINEFKPQMERILGEEVHAFLHKNHTEKPEPDIDDATREILLDYYESDYLAGWDGQTMRLA